MGCSSHFPPCGVKKMKYAWVVLQIFPMRRAKFEMRMGYALFYTHADVHLLIYA